MADANNYPRNALYGEPTMSAYNEPWYRRIPNALTDYIYGPNANAQQAAGVRQWAGHENPLNVPARAYQAGETIGQGYIGGDPAMMAMGGLGLGLEAMPAFARAPRPGMFEAVNDARMARQLGNAENVSAPDGLRNINGFREHTFGGSKINNMHGSDSWTHDRAIGRMEDVMARNVFRPTNQNALMDPAELRRLFRVVD